MKHCQETRCWETSRGWCEASKIMKKLETIPKRLWNIAKKLRPLFRSIKHKNLRALVRHLKAVLRNLKVLVRSFKCCWEASNDADDCQCFYKTWKHCQETCERCFEVSEHRNLSKWVRLLKMLRRSLQMLVISFKFCWKF